MFSTFVLRVSQYQWLTDWGLCAIDRQKNTWLSQKARALGDYGEAVCSWVRQLLVLLQKNNCSCSCRRLATSCHSCQLRQVYNSFCFESDVPVINVFLTVEGLPCDSRLILWCLELYTYTATLGKFWRSLQTHVMFRTWPNFNSGTFLWSPAGTWHTRTFFEMEKFMKAWGGMYM